MLSSRSTHSSRKVLSDWPLLAPLGREDAVARPKSQDSLTKELPAKSIDNVDDVLDGVTKNCLHKQAITDQSRFFYLYRSGRIHFHVHWTWFLNCAGQIKAYDLCAVFRRFPVPSVINSDKSFASRDGNVKGIWPEFRSCDDKKAMFIDNVQLRKNPENILVSSVPTCIRLQLLDCCQGHIANEWSDPFLDGFLESFRLQADRERCSASRGSGSFIQNGQLVDQVVQSGTGIVDTVTEYQGKRWVEFRRLWQSDDELLRIRIVLIGCGWSVIQRGEIPPKSFLKVREVILCSTDFGADASQVWIAHSDANDSKNGRG